MDKKEEEKKKQKYTHIIAIKLLFRSVIECTTSTFAVAECKSQGAVSDGEIRMSPAEDIKL